MNLIYLPDTNIIVPVLNKEQGLAQRLIGIDFVMSTIVLGELYFGARKSKRITENLAKIERFAVQYPLINCDKGTADQFAQIKQSLAVKGRPIPENDIWIAASAIQHNLTLVTRDTHFNQVDGLTIEVW